MCYLFSYFYLILQSFHRFVFHQTAIRETTGVMYPFSENRCKGSYFPRYGQTLCTKTTKMCTNLRKCVNKIPHFGKKPTDFLAKTRDLRLYSNGAHRQ